MSKPEPLYRDFVWFQRTFPDRPTTEALLAPELENGNVSYSDYEAATRYSAGYHRYYDPICSFLAIPLTMFFRKPTWSTLRTCSIGIGSLVGCTLAGGVMRANAHFNFVDSLQNPSGFVQALENIQKKTGLPVPPGPTSSINPQSSVNTGPSPTAEQSPTPPSAPDIQKPFSINPPSKWDQIRAVKARTSTNSSWDALRQSHERTRVPSINSDSNPDPSQ